MFTILLVEDDPGDQALSRRAFAECDFEIDLRVVEDGEEALDYLRRQGRYESEIAAPRPDLMLLDLNLPKLDGKQVLDRMRREDGLRTIPVVALTTSKQEKDIVGAYDLGVNSFITKPVEMSEFIDVLKKLGCYWMDLVQLPPHRG